MTKGDFLVAYNIGHRDGKTDAYCPNDYDDIFDIGQQSCDHSEKPNKWINKPQESENEKIIRISKGTLKARTGRYVIYDVEWLKEHFNTTEAKLYGQPSEDCISRQAVLEGLASIAKVKAKSDAQKSLMGRVMFFAEHLPSVAPQPKTGHWIGHREHCEKLGVIPSGLGVYEWCSNCGHGIDIRDWSRISHNYCPKCGAKMQEVQE